MILAAWLHDMGWSQVAMALAPLALIIWAVHRFEKNVGVPKYASLTPAEKCWIWLFALGPVGAAKIMGKCEPSLLSAYIKAGQSMAPKAIFLKDKVMAEYAKGVPGVKFDSEDWENSMGNFVENSPEQALQNLMKVWPVTPEKSVSDAVTEIVSNQVEESKKLAQELAPVQASEAPVLEPIANELKPLAILDEE